MLSWDMSRAGTFWVTLSLWLSRTNTACHLSSLILFPRYTVVRSYYRHRLPVTTRYFCVLFSILHSIFLYLYYCLFVAVGAMSGLAGGALAWLCLCHPLKFVHK